MIADCSRGSERERMFIQSIRLMVKEIMSEFTLFLFLFHILFSFLM